MRARPGGRHLSQGGRMGRCGLVLGGLLFRLRHRASHESGLLPTLNCGSPVPRRWPRPPMPSAPRNVASAWSTFCWRRAFQTTRYPCPPIMLSSSPQPKRRWLPRLTARDARLDAAVNRILVRAGELYSRSSSPPRRRGSGEGDLGRLRCARDCPRRRSVDRSWCFRPSLEDAE